MAELGTYWHLTMMAMVETVRNVNSTTGKKCIWKLVTLIVLNAKRNYRNV